MISCVIPAFEQVDLFRRCLTSACAQTGVEIEVIVTDDSASDAIRALTLTLASTHRFVRYVRGPRTGNAVDNWNSGLDHARGELLVLVHQDEYFVAPTYLRRAVAAMAAPHIVAVIARTRVIGVTRPSRFAPASAIARRLPFPVWWLPIVNWIGPTAAFVFRPPHRFDPSLLQLADVEFYARVLASGAFAWLDTISVGSLGHHPDQITAGINPVRLARRELEDLATRSPPAISSSQHRLARLANQLRSRGP